MYITVYLSSSNGAYTKSVPVKDGKVIIPSPSVLWLVFSILICRRESVRSIDSIVLFGNSAYMNPLLDPLSLPATILRSLTVVVELGNAL